VEYATSQRGGSSRSPARAKPMYIYIQGDVLALMLLIAAMFLI
jgi:hypothetical protein